MSETKEKTLGQAIDELITALKPLDEATRSVAIRAACEHLGLVSRDALSGAEIVPSAKTRSLSVPSDQVPADTAQSSTDIRTLKTDKKPSTAIEMACIVAHYVASFAPTAERKDTISSSDLNKYFRQADYPLPKRIEQVLTDAKAAGYFDSTGRGSYHLNPVGYNLVVHGMPRTVTQQTKSSVKSRLKTLPSRGPKSNK